MATRPNPTNPKPVDFGPNVVIVDPSMPQSAITSKLSSVYATQDQDNSASEMASNRYAIFFKPGSYDLAVDVGYYMTVHGLGKVPADVTITGAVQSLARPPYGLALDGFWRGVENLSIKTVLNIWAISQATYLRRVHVQGNLDLCDSRYFYTNRNYSSGGFVADSVVDGEVRSGTQQQFMTRNFTMEDPVLIPLATISLSEIHVTEASFETEKVLSIWSHLEHPLTLRFLRRWTGDVWNMVFVGDTGYFPIGQWPSHAYTVVGQTPLMREKPFLVCDNNGLYSVQKPGIRRNVPNDWSQPTTSWLDNAAPISSIPITAFYIARAETDTADKINFALQEGYHLILTPGIYHLSTSINVTWPDTVILGLGMATLIPDNGKSAMMINDVDGVSVSGLIIDAGLGQSTTLLQVGPSTFNRADHTSNPTILFDICCRVGGAIAGTTQSCVTINSHNVIMDNMWLWRADHGLPNTYGWDINRASNGITVNGDNVIAYGLFVEHFQGYQTIWNGNGGRVYFYQSEIPYDVPEQDTWRPASDHVKGYASYKVADSVTTHNAEGLGVYCYFRDKAVLLDSAIEAPTGKDGVKLEHMVIFFLDGLAGSGINHVINQTGAAVLKQGEKAQV